MEQDEKYMKNLWKLISTVFNADMNVECSQCPFMTECENHDRCLYIDISNYLIDYNNLLTENNNRIDNFKCYDNGTDQQMEKLQKQILQTNESLEQVDKINCEKHNEIDKRLSNLEVGFDLLKLWMINYKQKEKNDFI